jgi:hypothetical protein
VWLAGQRAIACAIGRQCRACTGEWRKSAVSMFELGDSLATMIPFRRLFGYMWTGLCCVRMYYTLCICMLLNDLQANFVGDGCNDYACEISCFHAGNLFQV